MMQADYLMDAETGEGECRYDGCGIKLGFREFLEQCGAENVDTLLGKAELTPVFLPLPGPLSVEDFQKKVKKLGVNVTNMGTTMSIQCPFSDHADLPANRVANFIIGKATKLGQCAACGAQVDINEALIVLEEISKANEASKPPEDKARIMKVENIEKEVSFSEWRKTIESNFPDLVFPAEVGLAILAQILIKDITNPFAVVLVDVPSSGKTITINFFQDCEGLIYASDKFTPASFVSNATNVKKEKLKDIDLLPRLQYTMFLLRDLATLFSKRDDDLAELLGLLTRVLDGEGLNTDSGVHGQRKYEGEYLFMILAASTPIQPRVWNTMGSLGSRLFFLNMHSRENTEEELAQELVDASHKKREKICSLATKQYLLTLWHKHQDGIIWNNAADKQEYRLIISRCAKLLAKLRGVIQVWQDKSAMNETYDHTEPLVERAKRINQLFYNGCRGHALALGRKQIAAEDLTMIVELAIDSAPTMRARLFRALIEKEGKMGTDDVVNALKFSRPTALKEMEKMVILGVCHYTLNDEFAVGGQEKIICLNDDFKWFLSDECKKIRGVPINPKKPTGSDLL